MVKFIINACVCITLGLVPRESKKAFLQAVCTRLTDDEVVQEIRSERHARLNVDYVVHLLHEQQESILRLQ